MNTENSYPYKRISEKFFKMEEDLGLLDHVIGGTYFWERLRYDVHQKLLGTLGVTEQAHSRLENNFFDKLNFVLRSTRNVFKNNPFSVNEHGLLFYGHPRRKKRKDGKWWDIYCDPVIEALDYDDYIYFEDPYLGKHLEPARTTNIKYLDIANFLGALRKKLGKISAKVDSNEENLIRSIENEIEQRFSVRVGLFEKIQRELISRKQMLPIYKKILEEVNPELVVLVVSYFREDFIEACQELGIPVAELQHGLIHQYHMGYSFPGKNSKHNFPDYLLVFGEYWEETADFPIDKSRIYSVGYPYLEEGKEQYSELDNKNQILFISQGTVGEELSKVAVALSELEEINQHLVYKLHPGEFDRWKEEYPWLVDSDIKVIKNETPLYKLFAESKAQVGVNSTALFEGQAFRLDTYLLDTPGIGIMEKVLCKGYAEKVEDADDLCTHLKSSSSNNEKTQVDYFFAPYGRDKVNSVIKHLM